MSTNDQEEVEIVSTKENTAVVVTCNGSSTLQATRKWMDSHLFAGGLSSTTDKNTMFKFDNATGVKSNDSIKQEINIDTMEREEFVRRLCVHATQTQTKDDKTDAGIKQPLKTSTLDILLDTSRDTLTEKKETKETKIEEKSQEQSAVMTSDPVVKWLEWSRKERGKKGKGKMYYRTYAGLKNVSRDDVLRAEASILSALLNHASDAIFEEVKSQAVSISSEESVHRVYGKHCS